MSSIDDLNQAGNFGDGGLVVFYVACRDLSRVKLNHVPAFFRVSALADR